MTGILIDTNILVYLVDQNEPARQDQAVSVLNALELSRLGRLSVQNLSEFASVAIHKLKPQLTPAEALEWTGRFARLCPVFDLTSQIVLEALRGVRDYSLAYFDAQIWATARLNQVSVVFSEDFQDGAILEGIKFVNPFNPAFDLTRWVGETG
jgi:predicted nucleic acid-binding protein